MNLAIVTSALTKFYGTQRGIDAIDLSVSRGEVFGLLGPNGAGKTTTIRVLLDFIRATSGSARVLGMDVRQDSIEIRKRAGYLPGEFITYGSLNARELFKYFSALRGRPPVLADELCQRFMLDPSRRMKELSRGNRQKVGLVQAFMHEPEILILDEPTSGLDPLLQIEFQKLVREQREAGRTVFISSHDLPEVNAVCDRVGIIREGRLVAVDSIQDLRARQLVRLEISFGEPVTPEDFASVDGIQDLSVTDNQLTCTVTGSMDHLVKAAARFKVESVNTDHASLEDVFLAYYSGDGAVPTSEDVHA